MLDLKIAILAQPLKLQAIADNLQARGYTFDIADYTLKATAVHTLKTNIEAIHVRVNLQNHTPQDKIDLKRLKEELILAQQLYDKLVHMIPNLLHETVPRGKGAADNPVIKIHDPLPHTIHAVPTHNHINQGINTQAGADLAGARFTVLRGFAATQHRALINRALDFYATKGYEEFYVPQLVKKEAMFGTAQYPKFQAEIFQTHLGDRELFLVPTGEVPLTNLMQNQLMTPLQVNTKMMTHTPCFRKEVGAAGRDTKGIIRQHQFEKVELVRTCLPEHGLHNLQEMLDDVENFLKTLNLKYRVIELCAGDIGFAGHKAYDIEVWFHREQKWREIATLTWCHDFQARRMNARFKRHKTDKKTEFIHTLNATGLAAGRVLAAMADTE